MTNKEVKKYTVEVDSSIRKAIKKLDEGGIGFIVCVDKDERVVGIVTDGDFRRAILQGVDLKKKIMEIANKNFHFLEYGYAKKEAKHIFENTYAERIPVLKNESLVDVITKEEFFKIGEKGLMVKSRLDLPVIIMAGGTGRRLDPFTRILPKALIPVGDEPIIEVIMDRFAQYGIKNFYVSLHYKARMIKAYFEDSAANYSIEYIEEDKPLGTAGALKELEGKVGTPFFVTNCDIIVECDYAKLYDYHRKNRYDLTLVGSTQVHTVPYGICEIENGGRLKAMREKPEFDFLVNTGVYVLNPDILKLIPRNTFFNITDLINRMQKEKKAVGVYPVSEKAWKDFGQGLASPNAAS